MLQKLLNRETQMLKQIWIIAVLTPLKPAFPILLQLLNIVQTIAVTSSSCERTFSSLKRIKTYFRSTMGDERLSSLTVLSMFIQTGMTMILLF